MDRCLYCGTPLGTGPCPCRAIQSAIWRPTPPDPKDAVDVYRQGWEAGCANHRDLLKQLREKDARIVELEAGHKEQVRLRDEWRKSAEELPVERDQLRARVKELERQHRHDCPACVGNEAAMHNHPTTPESGMLYARIAELRAELDAARAECETWKKNLADAQSDCAAEAEECEKLRAASMNWGKAQFVNCERIQSLEAHAARMREALEGVIAVADRKTKEFDAAREALSAWAARGKGEKDG